MFYNTQHLEKTAEMRVFFPDHVQRLRVNNTKRKRSDVSDAAEVPGMRMPHTVGRNTEVVQQKRKSAPDGEMPERGEGGENGTQGAGNSQMDVSGAPSRLEQDLSCKPDAAVMVRLRVKGQERKADRDGADGCDRKGEDERSLTLVCAHVWFDPFRPDLKTAQCKILFDAIERFHEKCGVITTGGNEAGVEAGRAARGKTGASGPANLILCGDFNSVPVINPVFLPGSLKVGAIECGFRFIAMEQDLSVCVNLSNFTRIECFQDHPRRLCGILAHPVVNGTVFAFVREQPSLKCFPSQELVFNALRNAVCTL